MSQVDRLERRLEGVKAARRVQYRELRAWHFEGEPLHSSRAARTFLLDALSGKIGALERSLVEARKAEGGAS